MPEPSIEEREFRSWFVPSLLFPIVAVIPLVKFLRIGSLGYAAGIAGVALVSLAIYSQLV